MLGIASAQDIVRDVRIAVAEKNFALGESLIKRYQTAMGATPEMIEAVSWLGRGALAARQLDRADAYAAETRKLALQQLTRRKLDDEPHLPGAMGASFAVPASLMAPL